jgi:predicted dehydrogenase
MAESLRTGLVGCGKVGHTHAAALRALPDSELVAVCDRNLDRAQAFAAQYGVRAYTGTQEMVEREKLQAVIVCTPHPVHAPPVLEALRAGAHVLVEKPMATTLADCDAMLAAARQANVRLGVISQRRLYVPARRVKAAIEAGKIGQPILGMVTMLGWRDEAYYRSIPGVTRGRAKAAVSWSARPSTSSIYCCGLWGRLPNCRGIGQT